MSVYTEANRHWFNLPWHRKERETAKQLKRCLDEIARLKRGDFTDKELAVIAKNPRIYDMRISDMDVVLTDVVSVSPPCPVCGPVCRGDH